MKILVICGLTASGKTTLALKIAKKIGNTSIISVDSRQAYQGLPVLSGQDIPLGFTRHKDNSCKYQNLPGVYFSKDFSPEVVLRLRRTSGVESILNSNIHIWGVDQVPPSKTLNISSFTKFIWKVIKKETLAGRKIIIVGGAGLYLKALTQPMLDIHLGFNQTLRKTLSKLSVEDLQEKLQGLDTKKFTSLNQSDKSNPRRLIRAIEILTNTSTKKPIYLGMQRRATFRWVGLKPNLNILEKNVRQRVLKRLKNQAENEVAALTKLKLSKESPISTALGLYLVQEYLDKKITKDNLIDSWVKTDINYAKRQLTWFKKQSSIIWYDLDSNQKKLINTLSSWLKTTKHSATQ
jgi:tRNA dimethylallyltransferase